MIRKLFLIPAVIIAASITIAHAQQTGKVTPSGIGYLEYLPQGYHSNKNKYPVVIALHGIKEKGVASNDPAKVKASLPKVANVGLPKYVKNGQQYPFILISPQLKSNYGTWPASYVMEVVNHVKKTLRVDEKRIYLTGLSLGGFGVWTTAGAHPEVFAAIAPICSGGNAISKAPQIASKNLPIWAFHGGSDKVVSHTVTTAMVNAINAKKPSPLAKATIFPGMGHTIWDKAYKQTNLIDWLLKHRKGSTPPKSDAGNDNSNSNDNKDDNKGGKNIHPFADAGPDRVLTLPTNSITIQGKASDKDGKIVSYQWAKTYGNSATLSGANTSKVRISNLKAGVYIFRLRVKDNNGAIKDDYFKITVKDNKSSNSSQGSSNTNIAPNASAGPDRVLRWPSNSITIQGKASDRDGKIVSYAWHKTYGNRATLSGANTSKVKISNLQKGVYIFRLRVRDNKGAVTDDYFKITVKG
jgi:poly(3-hydroxybutyrate) depolymerase